MRGDLGSQTQLDQERSTLIPLRSTHWRISQPIRIKVSIIRLAEAGLPGSYTLYNISREGSISRVREHIEAFYIFLTNPVVIVKIGAVMLTAQFF